MSLTMVVLGIFGQLSFAFGLGLFSIFAICGITNTRVLPPWEEKLLSGLMFFSPLVPLLAAILMGYGYATDAGPETYHWHWLPVIYAVFYLAYLFSFDWRKREWR